MQSLNWFCPSMEKGSITANNIVTKYWYIGALLYHVPSGITFGATMVHQGLEWMLMHSNVVITVISL